MRERHLGDDRDDARKGRPPLFVLLGAFLLYFFRFGYDYGNSDQDEIIPFLLHRLDPGLFMADWFVNIQASEIGVRTYFVWLLNLFSLILPVWFTVFAGYVVVWLFLAAAVYKLAHHFTRDELAASATVVLALVLTPLWTLGGNDLVHRMLVPSMLAWTLGLWAVCFHLRGRFLPAAVLLGVASWFQALVGLHLAIILFLVRLTTALRRERDAHYLTGALGFGLLFVAWSSPAFGPLVYDQLFVGPPALPGDVSLFYVMAEFRLPHHYLPGAFSAHSVFRFAMLGVFGTACLFSRRFRDRLVDVDVVVTALFVIAGFVVLATLFTEIIPILFVAKLQFFGMTVFAKLLLLTVLAGAVVHGIPADVTRAMRRLVQRRGWGLAVTSVLWAIVTAAMLLGAEPLRNRVTPLHRVESPIGQVEVWARTHTPHDAVFAVPPSVSSFRTAARRAIVVNFKAIPFSDRHMVDWFTRLTDMAPMDLPDRSDAGEMARLDEAFMRLDSDDLLRLADRYRFAYVVRSTPLPGPHFEEAFRAEPWRVYRRVPMVPQADESEAESISARSSPYHRVPTVPEADEP